eukprot:g11150.t1
MLSWMNQYRNKYNETAYQEQISRYLDDAADTLTFLSNTAFPDPKLDLCRSLYPELVREREAEEKWCREQLFPRQEDDEGSDGYGGSSLTSRWGRTMVKGGMGRRRVTLQETVSLSLLFAVGLTVWLWVACCTTYFTQVPVHALKHPEKGTNQKRRPKAVRRRIIVED